MFVPSCIYVFATFDKLILGFETFRSNQGLGRIENLRIYQKWYKISEQRGFMVGFEDQKTTINDLLYRNLDLVQWRV